MQNNKDFLSETYFLDYKNDGFKEFTAAIKPNQTKLAIAVDLYYLVRDHFTYDPYHLDLTHEGLRASNTLKKKRAWCVEKATVLAACARLFDIPSRLGYSIVQNHIGVDKLTAILRREEIVFHGYVDLWINEKWVKCTPAFDENICRLSKVSTLEWNGTEDSLFQAYEGDNKFMEYLHFYGEFADVPIELMNAEMKKYYPHLFEEPHHSRSFSFVHL